MTATTLTKTDRTIIATGSSNAAGGTLRGVIDLRTAQGGLLTMKITNGATGPSVQCEGRVLIAHSTGSVPAPGGAGAVWKTLWAFGGGTVSNAITEQSFDVSPGIMHLEVEFTGNTVQPVTVEAFLSEITNAVSV
jgi:hypothetical protein